MQRMTISRSKCRLLKSSCAEAGAVIQAVTAFTAATGPDSGRRLNRGLEGLGITDHGRKLVAMLQSPLIQSPPQKIQYE